MDSHDHLREVAEKRTSSEILYRAAKETWRNREGRIGEVHALVDDFSGQRYANFQGMHISGSVDGVGSLIEIAERYSLMTGDFSIHERIAHALLAMTADDEVRYGREPVLFFSYLDMRRHELRTVTHLGKGLVEVAQRAGVAVLDGETAEGGDRIGGYGGISYNWGGFMLSISEPGKEITGHAVQEGDAVVALQEKGFRANGITTLRRILEEKYYANWHTVWVDNQNLADQMLVTPTIYTPVILDAIGTYGQPTKVEIHGISHITGGGIPEKLARTLQVSGKGAILGNLFSPPAIMLYAQEWGHVPPEDAYTTWNMGNGMLVITPDPETMIHIAERHGIEAKVAGVIDNHPRIMVRNKGIQEDREWLRF